VESDGDKAAVLCDPLAPYRLMFNASDMARPRRLKPRLDILWAVITAEDLSLGRFNLSASDIAVWAEMATSSAHEYVKSMLDEALLERIDGRRIRATRRGRAVFEEARASGAWSLPLGDSEED